MNSSADSPIKIDIWSDVACPWCYVGKRRLERALQSFDGEAVIEFHSFELAPDTPVDFSGSEVDFLARHKGMPHAQVEQMLTQMTALAAEEGLAFDYDALQHTKTLKAHELLHHAKTLGRQADLKERLLKAYFEQGRHVGRVDELVALAEEIGMDLAAARDALESGKYADDVAADIAQAHAMGIRGVPFYVFDERVGVSGAQPSDVFTDVLERVASKEL
ncbi:DsbA family oxidoreductase [Phytoactinopolyspora halotolerans]|uniref:DsbA family oxidoreductase n=1 Tax=Phytoactinopolyspora halotolerans TaxID=1981512 RepID=A0A6L9SAC2_9ACTN|nr:DsbA family oxidoreductase [Phytoactinopolyspora halotolerans]NEE02003.1 DsbA family oxidoreductase [Phytoactinopolyspora halotolerans]